MTAEDYIVDDSNTDRETARMELRAQIADPYTRSRCLEMGLAPGWRCLEVGAGSGLLAVWLADQVGPDGNVVAVDVHGRNAATAANLETRVLDISEEEIEVGEYDLVCCRALLIHLKDPEAALVKMVDALRPGGKLLVEEPDWGMWGSVDSTHPSAARWDDNSHTAQEVLDSVGLVATKLGRNLPGMVEHLELEDIGHDAQLAIVRGGTQAARFWKLTFQQTAGSTEEVGAAAESDSEFVGETMADPSFVFRSTIQFQSWGTKT
jgi:SAM-dependent methyltransferase